MLLLSPPASSPKLPKWPRSYSQQAERACSGSARMSFAQSVTDLHMNSASKIKQQDLRNELTITIDSYARLVSRTWLVWNYRVSLFVTRNWDVRQFVCCDLVCLHKAVLIGKDLTHGLRHWLCRINSILNCLKQHLRIPQ